MRSFYKKPLVILLIVMLLCAVTCAQAQQAAVSPQEAMFRPTVMPDRVVLTWSGDPTVSQAVTWRTDTTIEKAVAQIAIADPDPKFEAQAQTIDATTSELATKLWTANYHSATFRNLKPDTLYAYRVGDGNNWSEWFQFRTASAKPIPFSFVYFGDVQNGIRSLSSRVMREAFKTVPNAKFFAFGGDLVTDGNDDVLWGEFFGAGGWLYGMMPMVPVNGNHEYKKDYETGRRGLTKHWRAQFTLPENGPKGLEEYAWYTDCQGLRIIALNSVEMVEEQAAWLDKALSDNPNRWTIAIFHYPMFSVSKGWKDNAKLNELWKPLFDKYRVDMVLTGHDHTYARSGLEGSVVYVTSVCGSKMCDLARKPWMKRAAEGVQLLQIITIDGDKLSYESRTATGSIYDAFELHKQSGKANRLVDRIPKGVPERLRSRMEAAK